MTEINEQEIERRLRIFAEVELASASEEFLQNNAECPSLSEVPAAAIHGWPPRFRSHISAGCLRCRKRIALQWNISPPSLGSIVRHLLDGTAPEEAQILQFVQDASQAPRIVQTIRIVTPLIAALSKAACFIASSQPALAVATGMVFAPESDEMNRPAAIHYVHEGLRWLAPIEAQKQYVYVEATYSATVAIMVGSPSEHPTPAEPRIERLDLAPLALRGTNFTWRGSSCLGEVSDLTG
jgi:hypothetical protein